jgi:hypothetical protein
MKKNNIKRQDNKEIQKLGNIKKILKANDKYSNAF